MIYALTSILLVTIIFSVLYRARMIAVCPVCAGVVITWIAGTVGLYANQPWADPLLIAILLGATLGVLADKYGTRFGWIWKTLMVMIGIPAVYYIVQEKFLLGLGLVVVLIIITLIFSKNKSDRKPISKDLFKECC